jgi:hypothetical protein
MLVLCSITLVVSLLLIVAQGMAGRRRMQVWLRAVDRTASFLASLAARPQV